ncbi:MAG TPA: rRNA maturation RNase YbeY [Bacilli bacterium]|nr:rRNA maturation RNase YbeY [Bacilli bacterium]
MNYCIYNETDKDLDGEIKDLEEVVRHVVKREKLDDAYFNIIIVDNAYIKTINKKYRGIDRETDVISFALEDEKNTKSEIRVLGDIYISIEKAQEQSITYEHSLKRELSFLTVHGILHLLGYDHMIKEEEKEMFELQEKILEEVGVVR